MYVRMYPGTYVHTWATGIGTSKAARRIGFITSSPEPVTLPHHHHGDSAREATRLCDSEVAMTSAAILRESRRAPGGGWAVISKVRSEMETFLSPGRGTPIWLLGISSLGSWRVTARLNDLYARELKDGTWLGQPDARLRTREEMMRACPRAPPRPAEQKEGGPWEGSRASGLCFSGTGPGNFHNHSIVLSDPQQSWKAGRLAGVARRSGTGLTSLASAQMPNAAPAGGCPCRGRIAAGGSM